MLFLVLGVLKIPLKAQNEFPPGRLPAFTDKANTFDMGHDQCSPIRYGGNFCNLQNYQTFDLLPFSPVFNENQTSISDTRFIVYLGEYCAEHMVKTFDNCYVVAANGPGIDIHLFKISNAGSLIWHKTVRAGNLRDSYVLDLIETSDYHFLITGYSWIFNYNNDPEYNAFIIKTDSSGIMIDTLLYPQAYYFVKIFQCSDSLFLMGGLNSIGSSTGNLFYYYTIQNRVEPINFSCSLANRLDYIGSFGKSNIIIGNDIKIIICDSSLNVLKVQTDYVTFPSAVINENMFFTEYYGLLLLNENLDTIWFIPKGTYDMYYQSYFQCVGQCSNGDIILSGSWSFMEMWYPCFMRVSLDGTIIDFRAYYGANPFFSLEIDEADDGGIVMLQTNNERSWLIKTSPHGWIVSAPVVENLPAEIQITPVSATRQIKIENPGLIACRFEIFNLFGNMISCGEIGISESCLINMPAGNGIYIVRLLNKYREIIKTQKIVFY